MRIVIAGLIALAIAAMAYAAALEYGAFNISLAALETKYARPESKFMDIDGIRVHYTDQGPPEAPAVVLVHASFMNLFSLDSLAQALAKTNRVIRFDVPTAGLTGPDPQKRYSFELNMQILDALTTKLGVQTFALFGTSSGGPVAFRYAGAKPERVTRLVLINSAGMPRTAVTNPNRARGSAIFRWIDARHRSKGQWRENLSTNFTSMPPPEWLVEMSYDMGRRDGLREEGAIYLKNFRTGDPQAALARVTCPVLILWGMENPTVMHLEADVMSLWLTNAPSLVKKYPKVGHYLYMEIPGEVERDVAAFLAGEMDADLRVTRRLPI